MFGVMLEAESHGVVDGHGSKLAQAEKPDVGGFAAGGENAAGDAAVEGDVELLPDFAVAVGDDMARVGVDAQQAGNLDVKPGFFLPGPFALGREIALMFTPVLARQTGMTDVQAERQLGSPETYFARDAVIECDGVPIPALELILRVPEVTVFVSADLLTHPVAVGVWRWRVKKPILDAVSFD